MTDPRSNLYWLGYHNIEISVRIGAAVLVYFGIKKLKKGRGSPGYET